MKGAGRQSDCLCLPCKISSIGEWAGRNPGAILVVMKEESIRDGIGTGGYKNAGYEPGVRLHATRNENHYKEDSCYFDAVEVIAINDSNARQNALVTGEVDVINRVDLKTAHLLERDKNLQIFEVTGNQHFSFPMHTNRAPFDNNDVREALKYAFDRDELVKKILKGHGVAGNDHGVRIRASHPGEQVLVALLY